MARTRLKKKKKEVWEKQCRPILEKYVQSTQHKKQKLNLEDVLQEVS